MTLWLFFVLTMTNYDSYQLVPSVSFPQTPQMLNSDNKFQRYSSFKVQKHDTTTIFYTKNDFVALICAYHYKLCLYQLVLSVRHPKCWILIINSRVIPLLMSKDGVCEKQWWRLSFWTFKLEYLWYLLSEVNIWGVWWKLAFRGTKKVNGLIQYLYMQSS